MYKYLQTNKYLNASNTCNCDIHKQINVIVWSSVKSPFKGHKFLQNRTASKNILIVLLGFQKDINATKF